MKPELVETVRALDALNINALRTEWTVHFHEPPPNFRAPDLLRRLLAERLQEEEIGRDLDLKKEISELVSAYFRGAKAKIRKRTYRRGTVLERDYEGQRYSVEIVDDGFRFRGRTWRSLSQIAREITGTRWNGPRFFGLNARPAP